MHRSLFCILRRQLKVGSIVNAAENGSVQKIIHQPIPSALAISKSYHTSLTFGAEDNDNKKDVREKSRSSNTKMDNHSKVQEAQLETAAEQAAKSLPGDWTRTADELMSRLNMQLEKPPEDLEQEPAQSSLLTTMKVGRSFERTKTGMAGRNALWQERQDAVGNKRIMRKRLARKNEIFTSLYSQPRLGIFDAEKLKAEGKHRETEKKDHLWQVVHKEKMEMAKGGLPRNGFEEMIQWTQEGRMWTYPVDNEEHMHGERQYKFHDHVFLNHHLREFPTEGPIRRFMDLVVLGLSKNSWISVPDKIEHIQWFADYFREKQKLLESSLGDKAKMQQPKSEREN